MKDLLNLEYLKKNCTKIHSFGLGFIQIKLTPITRLHIYCPELTVTTHEEEVHDHRYGFESEILKGSLTNVLFSLDMSKDTHLLSEESCDPNNPIHNPTKTPCGILEIGKFTTKAGSKYNIHKDTLHRVYTDRAITFLTREEPTKNAARVVSDKNLKLTCPFSVNLSEDKLWKIVEQELKANY